MTTEELIALQGRIAPGPWGFANTGGSPDHYWVFADGHVMLWLEHHQSGDPCSNATLIAAAPNLLAEVIRLREAVEQKKDRRRGAAGRTL